MMMVILRICFHFLLITLPGFLILTVFFRKISGPWPKRLALAYGLGYFFITIQLFFLLFIFHLRFSTWFYVLLTIEISALFLIGWKRGVFSRHSFSGERFFRSWHVKEFIILSLIVVQFIFLFSNVLSRPTVSYDSLAIWSVRAKVLYYDGGADFTPDDFFYLGGNSHRNYPWHVPLAQFWFHENLGEYNDLFVNLIFVFYFICLLVLIFCALAEYAPRFLRLLFVFFLSSMPLFFYHAFNAYADLTLSYYLLTAFIFFYYWLEEREGRSLLLSGIFMGAAVFVKIEAIIYLLASTSIIILFSYLSKKHRLKAVLYYLSAVVLSAAPWLIFNLRYHLGMRNISAGMGFHREVLGNLAMSMFADNSWNIWWFIVAGVFVLYAKKIWRDWALAAGWLFFFLSLFAFFLLYIFTNEYQFALNNTAPARNLLTILPISVFLTALTLGGAMGGGKQTEKIT